jgi:tetratricopeptide (TPR) repeat protein
MVAIGILLGPIGNFVGADASEMNDDGARAARRGNVVSASLGVDPAIRQSNGIRKERFADAATALDVELDQLRRERDSLTAVRSAAPRESESQTDAVAAERNKLRQQLHGLLTELARRPRPQQAPAASEARGAAKSLSQQRLDQSKRNEAFKASGKSTKKTDGSQTAASPGPVDPMALGQSLFRTGDFDGALKAFELAKKSATDPHDRIAIKYLSAACLKKSGNVNESTMLFREVANSKLDDVLAECARWQLSALQWQEATVARIAQLRATQTAEKVELGESEPWRRNQIR